eukprot:Anaeramoba_flamelloidesc24853_g1_i2.p1 GENE.c24853_g1_i2~~c24853_g1_i2.p1  ORF type:complete len:132 (+),score=21.84 c24853_g1_i2:21-416(+)
MGSSEKEEKTWVRWFLSLERNDILTEVRPYFLEDNFNYTGLSNYVPSYSLALRTIRTLEISDKEILTQEQEELIQGAAKLLYGLIHARWIVTPHGAKNMVKFFLFVLSLLNPTKPFCVWFNKNSNIICFSF